MSNKRYIHNKDGQEIEIAKNDQILVIGLRSYPNVFISQITDISTSHDALDDDDDNDSFMGVEIMSVIHEQTIVIARNDHKAFHQGNGSMMDKEFMTPVGSSGMPKKPERLPTEKILGQVRWARAGDDDLSYAGDNFEVRGHIMVMNARSETEGNEYFKLSFNSRKQAGK